MNPLSERLDGTALTVADLALIGEALLRFAALPTFMRHTSPAGEREYALPSTAHQWVARDILMWTSGRGDCTERDRVVTFLRETGFLDLVDPAEATA